MVASFSFRSATRSSEGEANEPKKGLAAREATLWLHAGSLTLEHAGEALSRNEVEVAARTGKLLSVGRPKLFETSHQKNRPQPRLFALDALGEAGWLKALRLEEYAPRRTRRPSALQQTLFAHHEAWA